MAQEYDVRANLLINARRSLGNLRGVSEELGNIGQRIKGAQGAAGGLFRQLVAVGGTYFGLRAISQAFKMLAGDAVGYTASLEKTKIGMTAVIQAVEGTNWEAAGKRASEAFEKIKEASIMSPATPQEMLDIFQGIIGPIESAGFGMQKVLDITEKTVLAANALNVDLPQAQRDISLMVRGVAGMDTKLFSLLKSTGAIKEETEDWNKALTQQERVEKLEQALAKFAQSGKAFGASWAGVTSTFKGIRQEMMRAAFEPVLQVMARRLGAFNSYLLANKEAFAAWFERVGDRAAAALERMFDRGIAGFKWVQSHWDEILGKVREIVGKARELAPVLAKAAVAWAAISVGRSVVGGGLQAASSITGVLGAFGSRGGGEGMAKKAAKAVGPQSAFANSESLAPTLAFAQMFSAGGAAGGGAGGAVAAAGGAAAAFAIVAAALVALTAVALAFKSQWDSMATIFGDTGQQVLSMIVETGKALWVGFKPALTAVGSVLLAYLVPAWIVVTTVLRTFLLALRALGTFLAWATTPIWDAVKPAFDYLFEVFAKIAEYINTLFGWLNDRLDQLQGKTDEGTPEPTTDYGGAMAGAFAMGRAAGPGRAVPNSRTTTVINQDFRGSRIKIDQKFQGDTDPDRVVMAMMHDLTRQAESRISSGFAGALTR